MEANVTILDDQMRQHLAALAASQMRLAQLWNDVILPTESCQVERNGAKCSGPVNNGCQGETTDSTVNGKSPGGGQLPNPAFPERPADANETENDERTHRALCEWGIPVARQSNSSGPPVAKSGMSELPSGQQRKGPRHQTGTSGAARTVRGQENSANCPPLMDMLRTALISQRTSQTAALDQDQIHADPLGRGRGREACGKGVNAQSGHASSPWTVAKAGSSEDGRSGHHRGEDRSVTAILEQGDQHGLRMQVQDLQLQLQAWQSHEARLRSELDEQRQTQHDNNVHQDNLIEERLLRGDCVHGQQQRQDQGLQSQRMPQQPLQWQTQQQQQQPQQKARGKGLGPQPPMPSRLLYPQASDLRPDGRQLESAWLEGGFRNALGGFGPIKYQ
mmetsp:Transcript_120811/g.240678  ORF Transcript_120811/g.240678 Transcript_120811/m.240678 type:complete len:391 (-) Transcript_120811:183-1355(-)